MDKMLEERNWAVGRGDVRALLRFGESLVGNEEAQVTEEELADHRRRATTALRKAAREGDTTLISQLLKEGADINGEGLDGVTAAWYAAANENIGVLQSLTMGKDFGSAYADLDAAARDGTTPMMAAARNGNDGAVRFLLCEEADWRKQTKGHKTALDIAKEFNRSRVQHLLEAVQLCDAATVGGSKGTLEVARLLASTEERGDGANMRPDGCCEACRGGCSNSGLKTEDACRSGLDHYYRSAMHRAAAANQVGPMEVLLAYGANINIEGAGEPNSTRSSIGKNTPLMAAAYAGAAEAVRFLLKEHADWRLVDSDGKTALEVAFENQHQEVAAIIEAFANDERTMYASGPLSSYCMKCRTAHSYTSLWSSHTLAHTHIVL